MQERHYLNVPCYLKLNTYNSIQSHVPFHQFQPQPHSKSTHLLWYSLLFSRLKKNLKVSDSKDLHLLHSWLTKSSNVEVRSISHHCGSKVIFHLLPELLALFSPFHNWLSVLLPKGLPWWLSGKESTCKVGDVGSIPGLGRAPGGGNGNPVQHSCLENPLDRGAWWATVYKVAKSWSRLKQLSTHVHALLPKLSSGKNQCGPFSLL